MSLAEKGGRNFREGGKGTELSCPVSSAPRAVKKKKKGKRGGEKKEGNGKSVLLLPGPAQ